MTRHVLPALLLAAAAHTASAPSALAETPQQIAEAHLKAGLKLYDQSSFEAARLEFLQAQAVYPRPSLLRNLALCELKTNRPLEAMQHLRAYLGDPTTTADKRENGKKNFDEAFARTGHVMVRANDGAAVSVDGQAQPGSAPFKEPLDTLPGHHVLEARLGERTSTHEVDASAGAVADVDLRFEEKSSATPPVVATAVGPKPATGPGDTVSPPREPDPSFWTTRHVVGVTAGGLAVVAAGVGVGFLVARSAHVTDGKDTLITSPQPCAQPSSSACTAYEGARNGITSTERGATISFVAAAALGVTAALLILWPDSRRDSARLHFLPVGRDLSLLYTF